MSKVHTHSARARHSRLRECNAYAGIRIDGAVQGCSLSRFCLVPVLLGVKIQMRYLVPSLRWCQETVREHERDLQKPRGVAACAQSPSFDRNPISSFPSCWLRLSVCRLQTDFHGACCSLQEFSLVPAAVRAIQVSCRRHARPCDPRHIPLTASDRVVACLFSLHQISQQRRAAQRGGDSRQAWIAHTFTGHHGAVWNRDIHSQTRRIVRTHTCAHDRARSAAVTVDRKSWPSLLALIRSSACVHTACSFHSIIIPPGVWHWSALNLSRMSRCLLPLPRCGCAHGRFFSPSALCVFCVRQGNQCGHECQRVCQLSSSQSSRFFGRLQSLRP